MKIAVIGYSGAGKSTLAKRIANEIGLSALHLDQTHFLPNWEEREPEESRQIVRAELAKPDWVIDGNYPALLWDERLMDADRILWLNYPRIACLCRVIRRNWRYRGRVRDSMAEGCVEKLDLEFVWWILYEGRTFQYRTNYRRAIELYPEKTVILRNDRDTNRYLDWLRSDFTDQPFDSSKRRGKHETLPVNRSVPDKDKTSAADADERKGTVAADFGRTR